MDDLISRSALLEKATNVTKYDEGGWGVDLLAVPLCDVKTAPAVDAEKVCEQMGLVKEAMDMAKAYLRPVRHGRWEVKRHKLFGNSYDYVCSACGCDYALAEYNYCPHCGAKMDGDSHD